jgi:hypothetical protein
MTPSKSRSSKGSAASGQKQKGKAKTNVTEGSPANGRKRKGKTEVGIKVYIFSTLLTI